MLLFDVIGLIYGMLMPYRLVQLTPQKW